MNAVKYASLMALSMVWLVAAPLHAALSNNPDETVIPQPELDLLPEDVVRIVINALANNDRPYADAGIVCHLCVVLLIVFQTVI